MIKKEDVINFGKGYAEGIAYIIDLPGTVRQMYEEEYKAFPMLTIGKIVASKTQTNEEDLSAILGKGVGAMTGIGIVGVTYGVPLLVTGTIDLLINN